ncbi:hypothetical protein [Clostridium phage Saumur]|nr:hypothetical protein [Clostridium phage Saumur]
MKTVSSRKHFCFRGKSAARLNEYVTFEMAEPE